MEVFNHEPISEKRPNPFEDASVFQSIDERVVSIARELWNEWWPKTGGPVDPEDYSAWTGITIRDALSAFRGIEKHVAVWKDDE
jgi:hypothetical protein